MFFWSDRFRGHAKRHTGNKTRKLNRSRGTRLQYDSLTVCSDCWSFQGFPVFLESFGPKLSSQSTKKTDSSTSVHLQTNAITLWAVKLSHLHRKFFTCQIGTLLNTTTAGRVEICAAALCSGIITPTTGCLFFN